jgi:hypothetical protein
MIKATGFAHALQNPIICKRAHTNVAPRKKAIYAIPAVLCIDEKETRLQLGYSASEVSPCSDELIVIRCQGEACFRLFTRARKNVAPNPLCHSCSAIELWEERGEELLEQRNKTILSRPPNSDAVKNSGYGRAENELASTIQAMGLHVTRQVPVRWPRTEEDDRSRVKKLDIVVPSQSIAIEYNGLHWHHENSPTPRLNDYHFKKMQAAEAQGLRLITIFEDEWVNRRLQVENFLRSALGANTRRIGARKTSVKDIDKQTAKRFLEDNHIQGTAPFIDYAVGLVLGEELVAVMTLGRHHRQKQSAIVLNRLAFKHDVSIAGGASKLLAACILWAKRAGHTKIVSWSDNRWSQGRVYEQMGFKRAEDLRPDYSYVVLNRPCERVSKQSQKKTAEDKRLGRSERESTTSRGLSRIWDCGHKRWELPL